jgi:hypothetical protein
MNDIGAFTIYTGKGYRGIVLGNVYCNTLLVHTVVLNPVPLYSSSIIYLIEFPVHFITLGCQHQIAYLSTLDAEPQTPRCID